MANNHQGAEIICRFITSLESPYKTSESEINLQTTFGQSELTQLLCQLLSSENQDVEYDNVQFDFIIGGSILKTSVEEHIKLNSISSEKTLNITYTFKLQKPEPQKKIKVDDWIIWIKQIPTSNIIYTGLANGQLVQLNSKLEMKLKQEICKSAAIAYEYLDGDYIISSHADNSLRVSKITKKGIQTIYLNNLGQRIESIKQNPFQPGNFCAGGLNGVLYLFDINKPVQQIEVENGDKQHQAPPCLQLLKSFNLHKQQITCCQWLNNDQIITGSYDHSIIIFNLKKEILIKQFFTKDSVVTDLVINQLENTIISSHEDGYIKLWDINKEQGFPYKALNSNGQMISKLSLVNQNILLSVNNQQFNFYLLGIL